jgi:alginate O-acetyltransferase complex protein AlgI
VNFNSAEFLVFFPLVLILHGLFTGGSERRRHGLLLTASYAFYMTWDWRYSGLIAFSTLVDYKLGHWMAATDDERRRKWLLIASLVTNVGLLGFFKYFNFFVEETESVLALLGVEANLPQHRLLLPVGISFYTFQTLSYSIDLYRRRIAVERDLTRFALFVSFFPQLVAGPIVRASEFLPQLAEPRTPRADQVRLGVARIFRGLTKKIIFADLLALALVNPAFDDPSSKSSLMLLLALYGFSFMAYADFSGYSDIAIGAALCLGYVLPENFRRPYQAQNVREFWTRWHISLSFWLRDYLYIPLGGNRRGPRRTAINLMITMVIGGLWHGAGMTYLLWGAWMGFLLISARGADRHAGETETPLPVLVWRRFLCLHLIASGWILFRATDLENSAEYFRSLVAFQGGEQATTGALVLLATAMVLHYSPKVWLDRVQRRLSAHTPEWFQGAVYAALIVVLTGATLDSAAFIYFQF